MADISSYIQDFANAVYGEDVRSSMIELARAVNAEVESDTANVTSYTQDITSKMAQLETTETNIENLQTEIRILDNKAIASAQTATSAKDVAVSSATKSESYAVGNTNSRSGEDLDNAKYYCESAQASKASCDAAVVQAQNLVDMANAQVAGWQFYISDRDGCLYVNTSSTSVKFGVDVDGYMYVEVA